MIETSPSTLLHIGQSVIQDEILALKGLAARIDSSFTDACSLLLHRNGRVVVMGVGKSGHIARKISATFASTGTPSFFVHPTEANHGDLGMITPEDTVLAISNSGQTQELVSLLPALKRRNTPIIAMTGNPKSLLAQQASVVLSIAVDKEACPLGLAPTSSTTVTLVLGDALAIALLKAKGFTEADFAQSHPGGTLGKRPLLRIEDVMRTGEHIPTVLAHTSVYNTLSELSRINLGIVAIVDPQSHLLGVFSDGDLRRVLAKGIDIHQTPISQVMNVGGITIKSTQLAAEALHWMDTKRINAMLVVDENRTVVGAFNVHDLLRHGVM